jgi:hypothetical protein
MNMSMITFRGAGGGGGLVFEGARRPPWASSRRTGSERAGGSGLIARARGVATHALIVAGVAVAVANVLVVPDSMIAQASAPTIAGALAVLASQGAWVITAHAVARAVSPPLTAALVSLFGARRAYIAASIAIAAFST